MLFKTKQEQITHVKDQAFLWYYGDVIILPKWISLKKKQLQIIIVTYQTFS